MAPRRPAVPYRERVERRRALLEAALSRSTAVSRTTSTSRLAGAIAERFPARACFHAQQASGMSLKAALIASADDHPRTHVADELLEELRSVGVELPAGIAAAANALDLYYASSRYPDALAGADPIAVLAWADADAAIERARSVVTFARTLVERATHEPGNG